MTDASEDSSSTVVQMRLRPQQRPVLRLSRKVLIAGATVATIGIGAALAFAMTPQTPVGSDAETGTQPPAHSHPATEALNALPKDYTNVPKLGPPLPGDLGRPILATQVASGVMPTEVTPGQVTAPSAQRATSPEAQAREAAQASQLFFAASNPQSTTLSAGLPTSAVPDLGSTLGSQLASLSAWSPDAGSATGTKSEPDRKRAFLQQTKDQQVVSDQRLNAPASPYLLLAGSVVPAALITGISSDIPGQVLAQITQDVRDSVSGRYLLIPKGARLIGQYDNSVSIGQSRILLTWSRLILPSGKSLLLDNLSGADAQGFAGLKDRTNNHWASVTGAAAVSTLLSIGAQAGEEDDDSDLVKALRDGASDSFNRAGQRVVERQLSIQPTLQIRPGLPVRIILTRDLVLEPCGD